MSACSPRCPPQRPLSLLGWLLCACLAWGGVSFAKANDPGAGFLRWHRAERRVDADLQGWSLTLALERISAVTGWQVFVEPGIDLQVAARFTNRPEREALAALLVDVNFALLPARTTRGPTRLLVFRSSTSEATVSVRPATESGPGGGAAVLEKELIVRLRKGSKADVEELARKLGARVTGSLPGAEAYRLAFDSEEAATAARSALGENEDVAGVESNYTLGAPGQIDRLAGVNLPALGLRARPVSDGSTVIVALLDTGVSSTATAHSDFLLPGVNLAGTSGAAQTGQALTHGPAMLETILQGLAAGQTSASGQPVRVLPIDIYGGQADTSTFELARGIVVALERGADVINLSLSGPSPSPLVQDVLRQASAAGVLTFAAPGNTPSVELTYPAAYPEVMAVTASDRQGQVAAYANRGAFVDLIAPGTSLVPFGGETYVVNGTSVSTAYTAGLAAALLADTGRPAGEVSQQLREKLGYQPPAANPAP